MDTTSVERQIDGKAKSGVLSLDLFRHKRKTFLHRILTGEEKWIYFVNRGLTQDSYQHRVEERIALEIR